MSPTAVLHVCTCTLLRLLLDLVLLVPCTLLLCSVYMYSSLLLCYRILGPSNSHWMHEDTVLSSTGTAVPVRYYM